MSNSLKDQLLALGLAARKVEPKHKKKRKTRPEVVKAKDKEAYRIRSKEDRRQKQRAVALKREIERQRQEINQKIKTLIKDCSIRDKDADTKRNFLYKGRIRSVLATREQISEINNGSLGVVYLSGNYHLLLADKIEEIRQYAPDHIPDLTGAENEEEKENPVPDDLIW